MTKEEKERITDELLKQKRIKIHKTDHYIEIWKFFSQRKEELQSQFYTFITWAVGLTLGAIMFVLKEGTVLKSQFGSWEVSFLILIVTWIGTVGIAAWLMHDHKCKNEKRQKLAVLSFS